MPLSKSSRSSKSASRPSLLSSLSSRSGPSIHQISSHDRQRGAEPLGQPEKVLDTRDAANKVDESATKPSGRRRSRLYMLTSFFSPSPSIGSVKKTALLTDQPQRPKTATGALPSHIRENAVLREPVASALELTYNSASFDDSSNSNTTSTNTNSSISTVDNSSEALERGTITPASQHSALDFGFSRTDSPELNEPQAVGRPSGGMPALQKHQQHRDSSVDKTLSRVPVPRRSLDGQQQLASSTSGRGSGETLGLAQAAHDTKGQRRGASKLQSPRRPSSPVTAPKVRSSSAQPTSRYSTSDHARTASTPLQPRPISRQSNDGESRGRLRKSWMPGSGARSSSSKGSKDLKKMAKHHKAWIISDGNTAEYNTAFLENGDKVPELWDDNGTVLVHLHSKGSNKGPSFKVTSWSIEASIVFHELMQGELESSQGGCDRAKSFGDTLGADDATRMLSQIAGMSEAQPGEIRLYLPPPAPHHDGASSEAGKPDLQRLIAIRNLFAFLTGQPLVATKAHPTIFGAFLEISNLLKEFDFMSMDGTTWGEAVDMSFGFYISQLALADVRQSREKTLEAVILGERMKSWELYNEAYTHAVGKWQPIVALRSPLMMQISPEVLQRLERANLELLNRQGNVNQRLEDFEFPALFAGVANSSEFKDARTGRWRTAFHKMRAFTLEYYKDLFGSWPPKARSKKNPFSESGLNRLVLKALYGDMCSLYDLLVDRDSLTPRVIDQAPEDVSSREEENLHIKVLRKVLTEFDTSSPPVLPPVPFDTPKVPTVKTVVPKYDEMNEKKQAKFDKNIKDYELQLIMHKSYNFDTDTVSTAFLEEFKHFDMEHAKGKTTGELIDNRMGIWLFLYVVIQSLPLLVIDAPDLQFTEAVEYFLCQPPMGNAPWVEDAGATRKAWYQIPGSSVKVELSPDVVMFSVEATFERSHCWASARKWDEAKAVGGSADLLGLPPPAGAITGAEQATLLGGGHPHLSPLQPPSAVFEDMDPAGYASSNGGGSPASSAPGSPAHGPLSSPSHLRSIVPGSGLAQGRGSGSGYRSSFAGLVSLEPILVGGGGSLVDRRSSRVYGAAQASARSDSTAVGGSQHGSSENLRGLVSPPAMVDSPARAGTPDKSHARNTSSTFDDILKDIGNQQTDGGKPAKKKFGF